jgi:hypothetical protein
LSDYNNENSKQAAEQAAEQKKEGKQADGKISIEENSINSGSPDIQEQPESGETKGQVNPGLIGPIPTSEGSDSHEEERQDARDKQSGDPLQYVSRKEETAERSNRAEAERIAEAAQTSTTQIEVVTAAAPREREQQRGSVIGRPTELERRPELREQIAAALQSGNTIETVCNLVGIANSSFYEWMGRAENADPENPRDKIYTEFSKAVKKAQGFAVALRIQRIEKAGKGGDIATVKRTFKTEIGKDGQPIQVLASEETTYTRPQWQADAWVLERSHPDQWGRRLDINAKVQKMNNEELEKYILEGILVDPDEEEDELAEEEEER